jgi:hypothetical protein
MYHSNDAHKTLVTTTEICLTSVTCDGSSHSFLSTLYTCFVSGTQIIDSADGFVSHTSSEGYALSISELFWYVTHRRSPFYGGIPFKFHMPVGTVSSHESVNCTGMISLSHPMLLRAYPGCATIWEKNIPPFLLYVTKNLITTVDEGHYLIWNPVVGAYTSCDFFRYWTVME